MQANGTQRVEELSTVEMLEMLESRISAMRWLRICLEPVNGNGAARPANVHPFSRIEEL
ncbi:MAG TPA: hypothetical protein VN736_00685 [Candidatus Limnocylindrales bacterium]|nr:hypothetical protein [Candidatus Limnocylindrales bacterium]